MQPNPDDVQRIIEVALAEDIGTGDITANLLIPEKSTARLHFVTREPLVMCGGDVVQRVFHTIDKHIKTRIHIPDGQNVTARQVLIEVSGHARALLTGERTALNLLQRMSSVATLTSKYVEAVEGTKARILDTRKTMPGLRTLDKYAVTMGGGHNHRRGLYDGILIKDNHIALCGGITPAITKAKEGAPKGLWIEIECDTVAQVEEALSAGADRIMLDNMNLGDMRRAVELATGKSRLEASGGVNIETVRQIADTGVDDISVGALTHSALSVDIGLDVALTK